MGPALLVRKLYLVAACLFIAACSPQAAIDWMISDEDRGFAIAFVTGIRAADEASLEPMFDPAVWRDSRAQIELAPKEFPRSAGDTELIGYHFNQDLDGNKPGRREYVLITQDGRRWTRTTILTSSLGGRPQKVIGWNVLGTDTIPPDYATLQGMEAAVPWIRGGAAIVLVIIVGGIVMWRRRRRPSGG
jgi:hypothetical protein